MNKALINALRGLVVVGLVAFVTPGCFTVLFPFDSDALPWTAYHCEAEVIDELGLQRTVYSYDDTTEGVVPSQCFVRWAELEIDSVEELEDAWRLWLDAAIADEGWCIVADTISCEEAGEIDTCEAVTLPDEARDFCVDEDICCIESVPPEIDFEALQEDEGTYRWTPVGLTSSIEPTGTLRNRCNREVSFTPRDALFGEHPGDFALFNNNCLVPEPPEEHPDGLTLEPSGSSGDFCTYQVRFAPTARGPRSARLDFVQAGSAACSVSDMPRFLGRGRAGELSGLPDEVCLGALVDIRCTSSRNVVLTNDGPGIVTVESVEVTGNFELLSAASFVLESDEPTTVTVRWCAGIAGDVDEDGTLTIVSNGFDAEILVPLTRRAAGCP